MILDDCMEDFPLFKSDMAQLQASIFNNMAACSKKELDHKAEIQYTTKVVDL